jgi:hypothetical protein
MQPGRSDKPGCLATVEVGPWPKLKWNGRRRRELCFRFVAEWCTKSHQAGRRRSQRQRFHLYESATVIGTNDANDKNLHLRFFYRIRSCLPTDCVTQISTACFFPVRCSVDDLDRRADLQ